MLKYVVMLMKVYIRNMVFDLLVKTPIEAFLAFLVFYQKLMYLKTYVHLLNDLCIQFKN